MALAVNSTHLYPLENAIEHHADRFEILQDGSTAIFRRGQPFYLGVKFNRPLDKTTDVVRIVLVTGENRCSPTNETVLVRAKRRLEPESVLSRHPVAYGISRGLFMEG